MVLVNVVSQPAVSESPDNLLEAKTCTYSRPTESKMLGEGLDNLCFNKSSRWLWCPSQFERPWFAYRERLQYFIPCSVLPPAPAQLLPAQYGRFRREVRFQIPSTHPESPPHWNKAGFATRSKIVDRMNPDAHLPFDTDAFSRDAPCSSGGFEEQRVCLIALKEVRVNHKAKERGSTDSFY